MIDTVIYISEKKIINRWYYSSIQPGWYFASENLNPIGPYETENQAHAAEDKYNSAIVKPIDY